MPRKTTKPVEADAITVEAIPLDTTASETLAAAERGEALSTEVELPDPDAPAINPSEPEVSFKIDFSDKSQWFASEDNGVTKEGTRSPTLIGSPIDLALQLSKASWGDGYDQRLRLAFTLEDEDGEPYIGELNLNAVNRQQNGEHYVTSPARSLVGGLLAVSEAIDDMVAFCRLARFTIRPGRGKGVFIDLDIPCGTRWVAMTSAGRTNQISKDPLAFHAQLALIKERFRSCGLMLTAGAVVGDIAGFDAHQRLLTPADEN